MRAGEALLEPVMPAPLAVSVPFAMEPQAAVADGPETARDGAPGNGCTQAQLRRFIKSRPYVPMHELRRRFELNGATDDVHPIAGIDGTVWLGLPERECGFIAELLRQGEIGVELCHDPCVAIVVGVYPMRPVGR